MGNQKQTKGQIEDLRERAFKLLPHRLLYNDKREMVGQNFSDEDYRSYEDFTEDLEVCCDLEDAKALKGLGKELERIEKRINLVADVGEFPEPDWLVDGLVVRKGLTLLYGDSGTGKTTLCLYLADALQEGKDLFGLKCKQGKVIFVENDESGELLKSHRDKVGLPDKLDVATCEVAWDASKKEFNREFAEMLYYYTPDVVVIDAYTSLGIPDITRPESGLVLDELRKQTEKYHCAMVIIHHANKAGEQMGSSLHKGKMDSMVSLSALPGGKIILTQDKIRGTKFQPKIIKFDQDTLEMREANMSLKLQVQELKAIGMPDNEIVNTFPKQHRDSIRRYLREVVKWKTTK